MNQHRATHALQTSVMVAVIGSGTMGAGIAQVAAAAGHSVILYDTRPGAAEQAISQIRAMYDKLVIREKMTGEAAHAASMRLHAANALEELAGAGLVVEAIVEQLAVKQELFDQLEAIVSDDCILASNTSSLSITSIAARLRRPQRVVGMHFFNPVPMMALVEVVHGLASDALVAQCVYDTALEWGKSPVFAKSTPGFIVNRVARPYYAEGLRLLHEQAAQAHTIDALLRECGGFRMGPFELMDLIGHDVNFAVTQSVFRAYFNDPRFTPSLIQQELVNAGYLGRKSGRGFYTYDKSGAHSAPAAQTEAPCPLPTPAVQFYGNHPLIRVLRGRLKGHMELHPPHASNMLMKAGSARVFITDGRSATQRAYDFDCPDTVVVDLALDYEQATRVVLAPADQCQPAAFSAVTAVFQACGFAVTRLADVPGLAVMRTVCMLANEAADAVNQGVCSVADADMAMQKGVNYPRGPLAWADAIGIRTVGEVLRNLSQTYGEDRYRVSPLIQRLQASGRTFYE